MAKKHQFVHHMARAFMAVSILLIALCTFAMQPADAQDLPTPVGKVNDFAAVLDAAQRATLEAQLADLERATSAEVAVVTLGGAADGSAAGSSLNGRSIEEYATALFNAWGIGKRGRDNGVLILVAVQDRTMRIEVGYGLEGVLPDGLAGAVIRETFRPRFRANDYAAGILEGTARVVEIVRRNETLTPAQRAALDRAAADAGKSWGMAAFLGLFVAIGAFTAGTAAGARVIVQLLFGLCFTGGALFMVSQVAPRAGVWLNAFAALVIVVLGFRLGRKPDWSRSMRGSSSGRSTRWISGSSGGSSSGSGGSSAGSGGSFGGGRSGGGGASGSW